MNDARKVWICCRVLQMPSGGYSRVSVSDSPEAAARDRNEMDQRFQALMNAQLVIPLPGGRAQPVGMSLGQFLSSIGVGGVGHGIEEVTVEGSIKTPPGPRLILPS